MSIVSILTLYTVETVGSIYSSWLELCTRLELPVTSWREDDPTRVLGTFLARTLGASEEVKAEYIKGGWLSTASPEWSKVIAKEVYGVTVPEPTYAQSTVTLVNEQGGYYYPDAGDITVQSTASGKTYHSLAAPSGALVPGATVTVLVEAEEPGSDSSAAANEIDTLVSAMPGVRIVSSTAALGTDEPSKAWIVAQCTATLGALSPNGPADAYAYVCRNADLTGTTEITRAKATCDDDHGLVAVSVAGASGTVSDAAVALAQAAVVKWAKPLTVRPTVSKATVVPVNVTLDVRAYDLPSGFNASAASAVALLIGSPDIGDVLTLSDIRDAVYTTARGAGASQIEITITAPTVQQGGTFGSVLTPGTITITSGAPS